MDIILDCHLEQLLEFDSELIYLQYLLVPPKCHSLAPVQIRMADDHHFMAGTSQRVQNSISRRNHWKREAVLDYHIPLCFTVHLNPGSPYFQLQSTAEQHQQRSLSQKDWILDRLQESLLSSPRLYFELKSIGSFNRHCSEGYGYLDLGLDKRVAGTVQTPVSIQFWRPLNGPRDELRTFFLGSAPEYETPPYLFDTAQMKANIDSLLFSPAGDDNNYYHSDQSRVVLNKFGNRVISSTGTLQCRLDIGYQMQAVPGSSGGDRGAIQPTTTAAAVLIEKRRRQRSMGSNASAIATAASGGSRSILASGQF